MIPSPKYNNWEARFQSELHQAEMARALGNEGKARVCARRAAGIAGHFLERVETNFTLPSDVDLIQDARWLAQKLLLQNQS